MNNKDVENLAKTIAEYLRKNNVICPLDRRLLENNGFLEGYIEKAIWEWLEKSDSSCVETQSLNKSRTIKK